MVGEPALGGRVEVRKLEELQVVEGVLEQVQEGAVGFHRP